MLAAGLGTRLRPLTNSIPKCLVLINERPLLDYWLEALFSAQIDFVLINSHHHADQVKQYIDLRPDRNRINLVFEPKLLGTGGTVRANTSFCEDGPVMIIHADNLCLSNLVTFKQAHSKRPSGTEITMMTFVTDNPAQCGIVETDERGVVTSFYEKLDDPHGNLANGAVYIFEQSVIQWISSQNDRFLDISTTVLPEFMGKIFAWPANGLHIDIGNYENLLKANSHFHP